MALAPITSPDVSQSAAPIAPENPNPAAFGATTLGAAAANAGQVATKVGDEISSTAVHLQTLYNDAEVANRTIASAQSVDHAWGQYKTLEQKAAVAAYLPFTQSVEDIIRKGGEGLPPAALPQYMQQVRRMTIGTLAEAANYQASQGKEYITRSSEALVNTAGHAFAANPTTETENNFHNTLAQYYKTRIGQTGIDPFTPAGRSMLQSEALKFTSPAYTTVIGNAIQSGDFGRASALLQQHTSDVSDDALRMLTGSLHTHSQSNAIYADADVMLHGGVRSPIGATPALALNNGQSLGAITQEQADAFHANPGKFIGDILGTAPLQVNSSVRSPAQEAALGGPQSSEHITGNGYAADLQLPKSMTHEEAITKLRMAGLPVDQFEVDGGALHVGFKPVGVAGRNMIIGQPADTTHYQGVPRPSLATDPDAYIAQADTILQRNAMAMFPNDAEAREKRIAVGEAMVRREAAPIFAQITDNFKKAMSLAESGNYTNIEDFQAKNSALWNSIPGSYQSTVAGAVGKEGNAWTPEKSANEEEYAGRLAALGANPNAMDGYNPDLKLMRNNERTRLDEQYARYKNGTWKPNSTTENIFKSPEGQEALKAVHGVLFANATDAPSRAQAETAYAKSEMRFRGAIDAEVKLWQNNNPNKIITTADVNQILANVTAGIGGTKRMQGYGFAIPQEELKHVDSFLTTHSRPINEFERGKAYEFLRYKAAK